MLIEGRVPESVGTGGIGINAGSVDERTRNDIVARPIGEVRNSDGERDASGRSDIAICDFALITGKVSSNIL